MIRRYRPDGLALALLVGLWLLFFWRLFTPVAADQVSLVDGDFSKQFVAFGAYQFERFSAGEVPLWNPYNNGGLTFIADTQAAVFYPVRLLTIVLADEWTYNTLQMEMTAHILLYTVFMYALVRRMTGSVFGGLVAAVIAGYGGFMSGYPPLQLAILEAGIWLPLALLGVLEATRTESVRWPWLVFAGWALGVSWMAGHPQTSWFATYVLVAYLGYRSRRWMGFVAGVGLVGAVTVGITAVTLFPGIEYLSHTGRPDLGFDAKGNGFPFQDVMQLIFPGVVSVWSPLYVGVTGLALAAIALVQRTRDSLFWGAVALIGLGLSFGANSAVFHALYNVLPGLSYFRGQERAAYVVATSMAILAGMGISLDDTQLRRVRRGLIGLLAFCGVVATLIFVLRLADEVYAPVIGPVFLSTLVVAGLVFLTSPPGPLSKSWRGGVPRPYLLLLLLVFELFSVNMDNSNYEPATERDILTVPPLVQPVVDGLAPGERVDGASLGLEGNNASIYGVADIRGISPLFLRGPHTLIEDNLLAAWEVLAVRYAYSHAETLPVPTEIVATGDGGLKLHRMDNPRPFAHLVYDAEVLDSDGFARALLADADFDARRTVILDREPAVYPEADGDGMARLVDFAPERITVRAETDRPAILTLALVDYPGWRATVDGEPVETLRAYGATTAIALDAGAHEIALTYDPLTYRTGAMFSLATWAAVIILGLITIIRRRNAVSTNQ